MFYEGHNMTKGLSKATDKNKFYMRTVVYTSSFLRILSSFSNASMRDGG
jgi:hypothetical protein